MMRRKNSPVLLDRLLWVVKYGPSKVRSHIQVWDEKHIYYVARKEKEDAIIWHDNSKYGADISTETQQMH